jgi:hypothetical protein
MERESEAGGVFSGDPGDRVLRTWILIFFADFFVATFWQMCSAVPLPLQPSDSGPPVSLRRPSALRGKRRGRTDKTARNRGQLRTE